jgi:hypothetical protein
MLRRLIILSIAASAAVPAVAASYNAKLTAQTTGRIVAREINWACGAGACQGATAESRPAVLCEALAKRAGKLDSFAVDGRAFSSAQLDKCNTAAKAEPTKAIADR